jgi:cytochrome c2
MNKFLFLNRLILSLFFLSGFLNQAYNQSIEEGKELFVSQACAACHDRSMTRTLIGPGLAGVEERWDKREELYQFIRNPQELIDAKHPYATKLFEEFNQVQMTPAPNLTDSQIESMLMYINSVVAGEELASGAKADPLAIKGKELYISKGCATCHDVNFKTQIVGPILTGTLERWDNIEDLYQWIRDPQVLLDAGHPYATQLFEDFNRIPMPAAPGITDEEIEAILFFIANPPAEEVVVVLGSQNPYLELDVPDPGVVRAKESFFTSTVFYIIILVLLFAVASWLAVLVARIRVKAYRDEFGEELGVSPLAILFTNRTVIKFAVFGFLVFGTYYTTVRGINLGRQQNYEPDQPIIYSHKVHAGDHKIDCQFCHSTADKSKQATIPAASTCMKCHNAIKTGSLYGTQELAKIFVSMGFNPMNNQYIPDYDNLSIDEIKAIFTNWIKAENDNDSSIAEDQWANIVRSLTNAAKPDVRGPIPWIRVHNMPEHVYFNHAQHVAIGKIDCQSCHGPVEEMEVVRQYAPLSMGWCVSCHRQTEVKFQENNYYQHYFANLHEELKKGSRQSVTVNDIGGLDCQKCHY